MYDDLPSSLQANAEIEDDPVYRPCWDCHHYADCNIAGSSHTCACKPGYTGDGKSCISKCWLLLLSRLSALFFFILILRLSTTVLLCCTHTHVHIFVYENLYAHRPMSTHGMPGRKLLQPHLHREFLYVQQISTVVGAVPGASCLFFTSFTQLKYQ